MSSSDFSKLSAMKSEARRKLEVVERLMWRSRLIPPRHPRYAHFQEKYGKR